jgi:hypothetical protein
MARPSETACTRATLTEDAACLINFNLQQRKALLVYFAALELAALGGEDYTAELGPDGTLAVDSQCLAVLTPAQREEALLVIARGNAEDAGATVPTDNDGLATGIACLQNQPIAMLDAMFVKLTCELGRHAAYPQVNL